MTKDNSKPSRERRAREAAQRQAEYSALNAEGRLVRLNTRVGHLTGAKRERARLEALAIAGG